MSRSADGSGAGRGGLGTKALVDLVLDPRDPGYEAAARRRADRGELASKRWSDRPLVAVACLAVGFVIAVALVHANRSAPAAARTHDELVARVRAAEKVVSGLSAEQARVAADLDSVRRAGLSGDSQLAQALQADQAAAGLVAVSGPGLRVTLSEPAAPKPAATGLASPGARTPAVSAHILTDRDVRGVVDELWADGAQAVAVNGIRLTPTSAIRFAGDAVLVDFVPLSSPYTIEAIGNPDLLATRFASSAAAARYQTLAEARGIGFSFADQTSLRLPAGTRTSLRYAQVAR